MVTVFSAKHDCSEDKKEAMELISKLREKENEIVINVDYLKSEVRNLNMDMQTKAI